MAGRPGRGDEVYANAEKTRGLEKVSRESWGFPLVWMDDRALRIPRGSGAIAGIELLVVIAIIAIVASSLLPAPASAKRAATVSVVSTTSSRWGWPSAGSRAALRRVGKIGVGGV
jgi:hypothetical protein